MYSIYECVQELLLKIIPIFFYNLQSNDVQKEKRTTLFEI